MPGVILLLTLLALPDAAHSQPVEGPRPRIGLALGGGAARGIAHIGFLEWLEAHRVPVDLIAGTSMGGLIGGAYASGLSTSELRELIANIDWDLVFINNAPFKYKYFRRKQDARLYPGQVELGLKGGLQMPTGLNPGQQIELALNRIAAAYPDIASFDLLPIPFRCVAADLQSRQEIVLESGSLSQAMRATMAIPGVFTPVARDGQILVDGGMLNNVPADVVKRMGAGVVIAVNVGAATDAVNAPRNMFDVLGQAIDVMMAVGVNNALTAADLVVTPELQGLTGMDWRRSDELIRRGYAAAEAQRAALMQYSVDERSYEAWRQTISSRRRVVTSPMGFVRVEGVADSIVDRLRLDHDLVGKRFDPEATSEAVLQVTGTDRYALVRYRVEEDETGAGLVMTAEPKPYGPPFLYPAIDLENIDSDSFAMNFRARAVFLTSVVPGSEIRVDGAVGTRQHAGAELYTPIGRTRLFVAPRAYWGREPFHAFDDESRLRAEYRKSTTGAGVDIGLDLGRRSQVRVGYDVADVRARLHVGEPSLPSAEGANRTVSIRWDFDGQTSPSIPTRGVYLRTQLSHFFDTPELSFAGLVFEGPTAYTQGEATISVFRSISGGRHRLFIAGSGGSSFGDDPGFNEFELGGLLRLGAYHAGELRDDNYLLAEAGTLFRVLRLPDAIGGNGYIGAWLETGSTFQTRADVNLRWNGSGGLVLETILGPVFIGGSVGLNDKKARFYVNVGPFFR